MQIGWAVVEKSGLIVINSVSLTRRSAIVNWMVIKASENITAAHNDEQIENMWELHSKKFNVKVYKVNIQVIEET
jgi:hypothetical protein